CMFCFFMLKRDPYNDFLSVLATIAPKNIGMIYIYINNIKKGMAYPDTTSIPLKKILLYK
ncbi:hypothetical protein, partial [Enterococcus faecium]|uniref:hypothetical protein n=1 Tax=Enterococcus faecium TaxID=1352 RepID=UPI001EE3458C